MNKPKAVGAISMESQLVVDRLRQATKEGEVVTYDELSALVGRDVQRKARYCLATAVGVLLREDRVYFGAVRGVGLKRCNSSEALQSGSSYVRKIRRASAKGSKIILGGSRYNALSKEEQAAFNAKLSILGAIRHATGSHQVKAVEAKAQEAGARLPVMRTLEVMRDGDG